MLGFFPLAGDAIAGAGEAAVNVVVSLTGVEATGNRG